MERLRALWASGVGGKLLISLGGLGIFVVVCCTGLLVITAIFRPATNTATTGSTPSAVAQAATAVSAATAAPASTEAPTPLPAPTATPELTNTPKPTATPAPTEPPTNTPEPTATPAPIVFEGSGQTVTDPFTPPSGIYRVSLTHDGSRNFIVHAFIGGDEDSLVNVIGGYQGSRPLIGGKETYFEVRADGNWSIRLEPLGRDDAVAGGFSGTGDAVSELFTPAKQGAVPYNLTHTGERNFIVHLYCADGQDSVQNAIGPVSGSVVARFEGDPCFWEVRADGDWSLKPK